MNPVKAGIIGGAGYTGGEMIRILLAHPFVELAFVHSTSNAGNPVHAVHPDLFGETNLVFGSDISPDIDVLFLCLGHNESRKFLENNDIPNRVKIIDLSQDFRIDGTFKERDFVYGLPELQKEHISQAANIANPGCFATAIQLSLLPLAKERLLKEDVHISGITGSTGAGRGLNETSHFSWRNNNIASYKVFEHQHLKEINLNISHLQDSAPEILFVPYRGNFSRGILTTTYIKSNLSTKEANELYQSYYSDSPFTQIVPKNPDMKQVVNTNKCLLHIENLENRLVITAVIDNLLKGASGQAVQNMNLMFGLDEATGLKFKSIAF